MKRPPVDDLPAKSQIFGYWKERLGEHGFLIDWGEPSCWVCGYRYGTKYDIKRPDADWSEIFKRWDAIPLQRCHIIPRALGGTNDCANLFLMCRECHDRAPNTSIAGVFFEWALAQSHYSREFARYSEAFESFGFDQSRQKEFARLLNSDKFRAWIKDKYSLHWPQSGYASTSSRLTPATLVGLAFKYWETKGPLEDEASARASKGASARPATTQPPRKSYPPRASEPSS